MIHQAAKRTHGSAGSCGLDSEGWSRMLCSKQFKSKPAELCEAIAVFARKLCTEFVDPADIQSYTVKQRLVKQRLEFSTFLHFNFVKVYACN